MRTGIPARQSMSPARAYAIVAADRLTAFIRSAADVAWPERHAQVEEERDEQERGAQAGHRHDAGADEHGGPADEIEEHGRGAVRAGSARVAGARGADDPALGHPGVRLRHQLAARRADEEADDLLGLAPVARLRSGRRS